MQQLKRVVIVFFFFQVFLIGCALTRNNMLPTALAETSTILSQTAKTDLRSTFTGTPAMVTPRLLEEVTETPVLPTESAPQQTSTAVSVLAPGRIFIVDDFIYSALLPSTQIQYVSPLLPEDTDLLSPTYSEAYSFANNSNYIAYIHSDNEQKELWVSDLDLKHPQLLWVDWEDLLMREKDDYTPIEMRWGPNDKTIIMRYHFTSILIRIHDGSSLVIESDEQWVGISPKSDSWALWLKGKDGNSNSFIVVEPNGDVWTSATLPKDTILKVLDWAFSPDQSWILFADYSANLFLGDSQGNLRSLGLIYSPPSPNLSMRVLQWSIDSKKMLLFANDNDKSGCPVDEGNSSACWIVVDLDGTIIWPPANNAIISSFSAALSPDNKWIVLSTIDLPERHIKIISLETSEAYEISNSTANGLYWWMEKE